MPFGLPQKRTNNSKKYPRAALDDGFLGQYNYIHLCRQNQCFFLHLFYTPFDFFTPFWNRPKIYIFYTPFQFYQNWVNTVKTHTQVFIFCICIFRQQKIHLFKKVYKIYGHKQWSVNVSMWSRCETILLFVPRVQKNYTFFFTPCIKNINLSTARFSVTT